MSNAFPTQPPVADSLESAVRMLEDELDNHYRHSLYRVTESASGIPHMRTTSNIMLDVVRKEALATALSRLMGYRITNDELLSNSYNRIDGAAIVRSQDARFRELADKAAAKAKR